MRAFWTLLASIPFFCTEGRGMMASTSGSSSSGVPTWNTLLKPYMSMYDSYYVENQGNEHAKGRNILSATLVESFSELFSNANWNYIGLPHKNLDNPAETSDPVQQFYTVDEHIFDHCSDDMKIASVLIRSVYTATVHLFINLAFKWSSEILQNNIGAIEHYLGLDAEGVRVINASITELVNQQRRQNIRINKLLLFFYYACDLMVKDRRVPVYIQLEAAKLIFITYYTSYLADPLYNEVKQMNTDALIYSLKSSLQMIDVKTSPSFGVSIWSMKMKILMRPTTNELVDAIQRRPASVFEKMTVRDYVALYAEEMDPSKINRYHLCILGVLITHVFGYVYNYFDLLFSLRLFEINNDDRQIIDEFSTFMNEYMSIFVDRYFEFYGKISQNIVDAMFRLMFFLSPNSQPKVYANDFSPAELSLLNVFVPAAADFSILQYYWICNQNVQAQIPILKLMNSLISDASRLIIQTFVGNVEGTEHNWYTWTKLSDNLHVLDKYALLELVRKNSENAFETLRIFSYEFGVFHNY